jgi:hypothetical protein
MKRVYSSSFFINAFTTLVAGFLAEVSIRLPLMLSLPGVVISCIIICFFPQEERVMVKHTMANYKKHLREALGEVKKNKRLQSLLIWLALLGVMSKLYFFTYNPYLEMVHVPYREVGAIFFAINIFGFIASRYATEIGEWLGGGGGFRVWFLLQGALMLIQGLFTQYLSGFLFALQGITRGYVYTVKEPLMNKEIGSEKRATVLSFQSSLSGLLQVMMFLVVSPLSGNVTMLLLVLGVASLALSFLSRKA